MKQGLFILLFLVLQSFIMNENEVMNQESKLNGAWKLDDVAHDEVLIFIDGYFTQSVFNRTTKEFTGTRGGTYSYLNGELKVKYEFDTADETAIGSTKTYRLDLDGDELKTDLNGSMQEWEQEDEGEGNLSGLWKISARMQNNEMREIHQSGTRKTIKILSATRFQWAAIDPGKKQFSGTGGGKYEFKDGKYIEHIEFFSRDSARVGSSLQFDGKLENGDWHHSGKSSKGDDIYEVWKRKGN